MGNQHVVKREDGWAVRREGANKDTSRHSTQEQAIETGTEIAKNQKGELLIHDRHGKIRERNSYGNDPFPPRG